MLEHLREHDLRSAPVTRSDGTLVGLVLRSDLERAILEQETDDHVHAGR